ncbi:MAG: hypothetical protein SFY66_06205 [Oculatellaceae cyanobacterium bins.114]|nr:hypothetical protein [Oculatellaceae cyanobacterium bins.114]
MADSICFARSPFNCMRVRIENQILFIHRDDLPQYKKTGSIVRNSYFWALKSIAASANRSPDWEYDDEVWLALQRLLLSFAESSYLGLRETQLEFPASYPIPTVLKPVSTWE